MKEKQNNISDQEIGRNDPCPCGSTKKYKQCCLLKQQQKKTALGGRKFTAKVISAGGLLKKEQSSQPEQSHEPKDETKLPHVDYGQLMERSFGSALHQYEEVPPKLSSVDQYIKPND